MRRITTVSILIAGVVGFSGCVYFNTYYNAQKYFRQAEKARKIETERQLRRGRSENEETRFVLSAKTEGLYEDAARKAFVVLEEHPESDLIDDAAFLMARSFFWQGNYLSAVRTLKDLEENFPDSEHFQDAQYWRALSYEEQGDQQAEELYRGLFASGSEDLGPKAGFRLGEIAFAAMEYAAAVQEFRRTLEAYPDSDLEAELYLRMGEALVAMEDTSRFDAAVDAFTQVGRSSAERRIEYSARLNVGNVEYARGDVNAALTTFQRLLKESKYRPFEGRTRLAIGQLYRDRQQVDDALREFEQVRDDFPGSESSAMALYRTGLLYLQEYGETERAEEYFRETKAEKPNSAGARLGQLLLKDLGELQRLRSRIHRADSLAMARGKTLPQAPPTATLESAPADTVPDAMPAAEGTPVAEGMPALRVTAVDDSSAAVSATIDSAATGPVDTTTPEVYTATGGTAVVGEPVATVVEDGATAVAAGDTVGSSPADPVLGPDWFFARVGKSGMTALSDSDEKVIDDLFEMADIYRTKIEHPDSSSHYFHEIVRRYPNSEHVLRALYAIAWIHLEMRSDEEAARPYLDKILSAFSASEHANAARRYLGMEVTVTNEEAALVEFIEIENILVEKGQELDRYIPLMDSLSARYPDTRIAARAAFRAAWQYENVAEDSLQAARRYEQLVTDFPNSDYAEFVEKRREAEKSGLIDKLERELKSVGGVFAPGEHIDVIAVEPDSADSMILAQKHFRFGLRAYNRGDFDRARDDFELSLEQKRRNPDALHLLGNVLWEQGYPRDAIDRFQDVLHFSGNHLGVKYSLFRAYVAEGVADSANYYLQAVIGQDSRNSQIQFLLEEHPELSPPEREELDMFTLEQIELNDPEISLALREKALRLAERPLVRRAHLPEYPVDASGDTAEVVVDILVGRNGRPKNVEVFAGEEPFRTAALEAAEKYQFYPATRSRRKELRPLNIWVELVLPFSPPAEVAGADIPVPASASVLQPQVESMLGDSTSTSQIGSIREAVPALPESSALEEGETE